MTRWLLTCHDRVDSNELDLTQEFIAEMLGTRRSGVTEAAIILQGSGLIRYARGHITILDRDGLEDFACECYGVVKKEFDRLPAISPMPLLRNGKEDRAVGQNQSTL